MDICCPYIRVSTHGHDRLKSLKNPFWIFQAFEIFTKEILSKNSKKILACHLWHIGWPCKASCLGEQDNITKSPQNPLWPESNLNNFVLPTFSPWPQLFGSCSYDQMRPLHQVVHQGEKICMTKSWKVHFYWFLGFTKVTLATLPKWAQNWWKALIICDISPCGVSWQMEIIYLPKPASNTFCHFTKIPFLASSTNLRRLNFLPRPLLVPL